MAEKSWGFRTNSKPRRVFSFQEPLISPQSLSKIAPMEIDNEDSLDAPPSVGSVDTVSTTPSQKKARIGIHQFHRDLY